MICSSCKRDLPVTSFPYNKQRYLKEQKTYERHDHCKGCAYSREKRLDYQRKNLWQNKKEVKVIPTKREYLPEDMEIAGWNGGVDEIFC